MLSSFGGLQHQPEEKLLEALAAAMKLNLPTFKRQELASCLDAFKVLSFHPGNDLIQVNLPGFCSVSFSDRVLPCCAVSMSTCSALLLMVRASVT